jgi:hypothetical protein
MAGLLGIPKLHSTYILTPDCQPVFNPVLLSISTETRLNKNSNLAGSKSTKLAQMPGKMSFSAQYGQDRNFAFFHDV